MCAYLSASIAERQGEFALLKCLGATRNQILQLVVLEALLMGIPTYSCGILSGVGIVRVILFLYMRQVNIVISPFTITGAKIIVFISVCIVLPCLALICTAWRTYRLNLDETSEKHRLTNKAKSLNLRRFLLSIILLILILAITICLLQTKREEYKIILPSVYAILILVIPIILMVTGLPHFISAIGHLSFKHGGFAGLLSLKNVSFNSRSIGLIILCLVVLIAMPIIIEGQLQVLHQGINDWFDRTYKSTCFLFACPSSPISFKDELRKISGVDTVIIVKPMKVKSNRGIITVWGINPVEFCDFWGLSSYRFNQQAAFTQLVGRKNIVVSCSLAFFHKIKTGSKLSFLTRNGKENFTVVGTVGYPDLISYVSIDDMNLYFSQGGGYWYLLKIENNCSKNQLMNTISDRFYNLSPLHIYDTNQARQFWVKKVKDVFNLFNVIKSVAVTVITLSVLNIFFTCTAMQKEEMTLLKTIGATNGQRKKELLMEAGIVGGFSYVIGILLGLTIVYGQWRGMEELIGIEIHTPTPWSAIGQCFIIITGICFVVCLLTEGIAIKSESFSKLILSQRMRELL